MNPFQAFLHLLSDPNISFILFTIGFYGLLFELQSPNFVTGILGALAIILAFIGFGSLPLNVAGLLLIVLAMVLFGLELTVTSHGLLGRGRHHLLRSGGVGALHRSPATRSSRWCASRRRSWRTTTVTAAVLLLLIVALRRPNPRMAAPAGLVGSASSLVARGRRASFADRSSRSARSISRGRSGQRDRPMAGRWSVAFRCGWSATDGLTVIVEPDPSSSSQVLSKRRSRWKFPILAAVAASPSSSSSCW